MILAFTGTRYEPSDEQLRTLRDAIQGTKAATHIAHGGCTGADHAADQIAASCGITRIVRPGPPGVRFELSPASPVTLYDPEPYLARNRKIIRGAGTLLAVPRSETQELRSGTWATIRYALTAKMKIAIIWPDGVLEAYGQPQ